MRHRVGQLVALGVFALVAASWLLPDGVSVGSLQFGGDTISREVAPPLHEGTEWARYVAPEGTCRGDTDASAPVAEQLTAMRCLLDWARRERGVPGLKMELALVRSAQLKAAAIVRCGDFSHTPCREPFAKTFEIVGWRGSSGENIAWGASLAASPRVLADGWLHSQGHRTNLFRPDWISQGLAVTRVETFLEQGPASVWVHQFGRPE